MFETTFETELGHCEWDHEYTAFITYRVSKDWQGCNEKGREILDLEVVKTEYFHMGAKVHAEGRFWDKLEELALEAAEEHFFKNREAA